MFFKVGQATCVSKNEKADPASPPRCVRDPRPLHMSRGEIERITWLWDDMKARPAAHETAPWPSQRALLNAIGSPDRCGKSTSEQAASYGRRKSAPARHAIL